MRERFAKKREPVWYDWAEGSERGREMGRRGQYEDGHSGKISLTRGTGLKEGRKECEYTLKVIWPGVVKHFSSFQLFCPRVHTAGCSQWPALTQSRTANVACSVSQSLTFKTRMWASRETCRVLITFVQELSENNISFLRQSPFVLETL